MRSPFRILLNALTVLSLALALAAAGVWYASRNSIEWVVIPHGFTPGGQNHLGVSNGRVWYTRWATGTWGRGSGFDFAGMSLERREFPEFFDNRGPTSPRGYLITYSMHLSWVVCVVLASGGGATIRWLVRAGREVGTFSCPTCGYDLRATPARCPECGAVPAGPRAG